MLFEQDIILWILLVSGAAAAMVLLTWFSELIARREDLVLPHTRALAKLLGTTVALALLAIMVSRLVVRT